MKNKRITDNEPVSECMWFPVCPMKRLYEAGKLDGKWIRLFCHGDWHSCIRFKMEQSGEYHPDWMLPDGTMDNRLRQDGSN